MKLERLMGILTLLLQNDMVTAPRLAERFEVSRRTISRDIEELCKAGIPLVTIQGNGGGIKIADGYKIDKTLFTGKEIKTILAGLKAIDSVDSASGYQTLADKIYGGSREQIFDESGHIVINLASHYKGSLSPKIQLLQEAISLTKVVEFDYLGPGGDCLRRVEPYLLVFEWSSWYLYGYCLGKQDYRLFKLNRIWNPVMLEHTFDKRQYPDIDQKIEHTFENKIHLTAVFDKSCRWKLADEYGMDSFLCQSDGGLYFERDFTSEEYMMSWLLSFGDKVKIIEPSQIREKYLEIIQNIWKAYSKT